MWWLLLLLIVGYFAWAKQREGMTSASEMNLMQVGEIQTLEDKLRTVKLTQARVDVVKKCVDTNLDNASAVQANMKQSNTNGSPNAYPT